MQIHANRYVLLRLPLLAAVLTIAFGVCACGDLALSPRQKVVQDAQRAVCNARSIKAMAPFLSEKSRPMLELTASLAELGQSFGIGNMADKIAIECQSAKSDFLEEVKVSGARYIVRTKSTGDSNITETVVVQEAGEWKISLF